MAGKPDSLSIRYRGGSESWSAPGTSGVFVDAFFGSGSISLSQSARFDNSQSFYTHTLQVGEVTLTQSSLFTNSNTLNYQHTLSALGPTQNLTQSARFDNGQLYYQHQVNLTLNAALFSNSQSYYQHRIDLAIVQSVRFDNAQSYYSHTLTVDQTLRLTQTERFDNAQSFFAHALSGGGVAEERPSRRSKRNPILRPIIDGHAVLRSVRGKSVVGRLQVEGLLRIDNADVQVAGVSGRGASGRLFVHGECNAEARPKGIACSGRCGKVGVYAETIVFARVDPSLDCEVNTTFRNVGKSFVGTLRAKGVKNPSEEELAMMVIAATRRSPVTMRVQ